MKRRIFFAVILIAAAWMAGRYMTNRKEAASGAGREETTRSFELSPGARVEVRGINGPVTVETSDTSTAEIRVVRTARNKSALKYHRIVVEKTSTGLVVRSKKGGRGFLRWLFGGGGSVRQEITLVLPRNISLEASGVNGFVKVGEVEGSIQMSGINGRVELAQTAARAELSGINGEIIHIFARLGEGGIQMSGINGNIEFRLKEIVDASIEVTGLNGNVTLNVPNVTSQDRSNRSRFRARLGAGGAPINLSGTNGNVSFYQSAAPTN